MRLQHGVVILGISLAVASVGMGLLTPWVFAGRSQPGVMLGEKSLTGIPLAATEAMTARYEQELLDQPVQLRLRDKIITRTLRDLGVSLNKEATVAAIEAQNGQAPWRSGRTVLPSFLIDEPTIAQLAHQEFSQYLTLPKNASLKIIPGIRSLTVTPSMRGELIDLTTLATDIEWRAGQNGWAEPIDLTIVSAPPSVHEGEIATAQIYAQQLLRSGLPISDGTTTWTIQPFTLERLLQFIPVRDRATPANEILGVSLDGPGVTEYLTTTITPEINQPAIDARFERVDDRVTQFAAPQEGRALNIDASVASIQDALIKQQALAPLIVDVTQPTVQEVADIETLGITKLLATGTSDYAGSPANRIHNIVEGTKRYHGLLIKPGQEFSFNEFLGPVDRDHGFKPELVIKKNVTIPEFGGGLCQVSTTIFRAATYAGLKITARRNHAYAVSYYGIPGFDATIYPPYTDLRFTNNTPGYILIQAKSEGTQLMFEMWGTSDDRQVEVAGPNPYGRTPDGAVKATLTQKVTKDGELIIDDTFYSRYQSPKLFPKPNATPSAPTPTPTPTPISTPTPPPPTKRPIAPSV